MKERLEIVFVYLGKILNKQLKGRLERRLWMLLLSLIHYGAFRLMSASVR